MKKIVFFLSAFFISFQLTAQEDAVKKIREKYNRVNSDEYFYDTLCARTTLAAIGEQMTGARFFYSAWQSNPETAPYTMSYRLEKVEVAYNIAASMNYQIEYLFDDTEKLIFYFYKASGMWDNQEIRYYFDKEKLIKSSVKKTLETGEQIDYSDTRNFKSDDLSESKKAQEKSKKYIDHFQRILLFEQIEK